MRTLAQILAMLTGKNVGRVITTQDEAGKTIKGRRRLRHYYRAGGALLARGKWVPPNKRHICFGEHGCNCWKHLKHSKRDTVTS